MCHGSSSRDESATGPQRDVVEYDVRERPGKVVHRKPEDIRRSLASPETGLSQEPPEALAVDGIDLLWGAEGGRKTNGPRIAEPARSDQPLTGQEVRRRSLIVQYRAGFPQQRLLSSLQDGSLGRCRALFLGPLQASDSSPEMMSRQLRVETCVAIPINAAETADASLDMTAEVVDAAPIGSLAGRCSCRGPNNESC